MAVLHIEDAGGRKWLYTLTGQGQCTIGRAAENTVPLNDPRVSRQHAHIVMRGDAYFVINGVFNGTVFKRSANGILVNGQQRDECRLAHGDRIKVGASIIRFLLDEPAEQPAPLRYEDAALGKTQIAVSARSLPHEGASAFTKGQGSLSELQVLRRKADILAMLYELNKTFNSVFNLAAIFDKATDIILRVTPADRVVALLGTESPITNGFESLSPVGIKARHEAYLSGTRTLTVSRTIITKALDERIALLSQDATADADFAGANSVIAQGVRSTICAPLLTESGVHGAIYADRLDPAAVFTRDDLEFLTAIASQTAVAVESARAHERLAREEVARANYSRFMPEYVVRQMLEHPESFKLGGANQRVTVLFADVRGFTSISEHAPPERVVQILNLYFSAMTEIIFAHGGTLDKYIGDGLMALFGAPAATPQDASNALAAAVAMQRRMEVLNGELRATGLPEISVGIGLHTGEATVGYIGSERRSEYTAIGDTVNLAARLESRAQGGQILSSRAVIEATADNRFNLRELPPMSVKNRVQPVSICEVAWRNQT
ncbi:MAG TPA: adenylate/guanylate cyclase domain-containing protein [Pyrinomonadaceae bacterium]|nr:adenylate/guanylate cyclase domain-containing protein [Pyrinomonadaceae bacterium]